MQEELLKIIEDRDLINKTVINAKKYIQEWEIEQPTEFQIFFSKYNLQNIISKRFADVKFEVFKVGYEIRIAQESIEVISVVLDLLTLVENEETEVVCSYYCFYDKNGDVVDDFIDWYVKRIVWKYQFTDWCI